MAKVKIQGHASGTGVLTVTAPNTSTDRTITLPDATGTLATTADTFDPDGAVTINESGANVDFRVESDTNANALLVRGSDGKVGIGSNAVDEAHLLVQASTEIATGTSYNTFGNLHVSTDTQGTDNGGTISMGGLGRNSGPTEYFKYAQLAGRAEAGDGSPKGYLTFETTSGITNLSTERLRITSDGRGLSQFTAKFWINFNGTGTIAARDSHNISSIADNDVILHSKKLIAGFKCPKSVSFREDPMPLSGAGKILKTTLRKPFWEGRNKQVS